TQELAQFEVMQSKKARKRAAAKTKKERRTLMLEARYLLMKAVVTKLKGDIEGADQLRGKASNRRAHAATLQAPPQVSIEDILKPNMQRSEVELLESLEAASSNRRRLMTNARLSSSPHPLRNYRRKYSKVQ
ncbi:hypothetical protein E2562_009585, partial [Oryza meyeriana var. granulata]